MAVDETISGRRTPDLSVTPGCGTERALCGRGRRLPTAWKCVQIVRQCTAALLRI